MKQNEILVKMVLSSWQTYISRVNNLIDSLSEEELLKETAPGRNTGIYLFGHLIAVNDGMLPLLGFGDKLYPDMENIFIEHPDKSDLEKPSLSSLKGYWYNINAVLDKHMNEMKADEWFTRHNAVSDTDFEKEPYRNKLNIVVNRTSHMSYHLGQLVYLK